MMFPPLYAREALVLGLSITSEIDGSQPRFFEWDLVSAFFPNATRADGKAFRDVLQLVIAGTSQPVSQLEQWACSEEVKEYFDLGREFGQLIQDLATFRHTLEDGLEFADLPALIHAAKIVHRLKIHERVKHVYYLRQAVEYFDDFVRAILESLAKDPTGISSLIDEQVPAFGSRLLILGIGLGDLMGVLQEAEHDARANDAGAVTPRYLWIEPTEDTDILRGRLLAGELALAGVSDAPGLPLAEHVVSGCVDVIDALVKRLWSATAVDAAGGVRKFLASKLGQGTPIPVRRFASIVTNLHLSYRNPAAHEAERFRCTLREAKYILCGIHVLIDLHDEIREQQLT